LGVTRGLLLSSLTSIFAKAGWATVASVTTRLLSSAARALLSCKGITV